MYMAVCLINWYLLFASIVDALTVKLLQWTWSYYIEQIGVG